jgi:hypothetical protein
MHRIVRIDKLIPAASAGRSPASPDLWGGSLWQRRSGYRLSDNDGLARVYQPAGTPWWNPLGGWTQEHAGIAIFGDTLPFVVSCHGPQERKRFYIDVVRWSRVGPAVVSYLDLFLDVMIEADGAVSEKDEHQLTRLAPAEQVSARATRDLIRARIAAGDPLFDPAGPFYRVPDDAPALSPIPLDPPSLDPREGPDRVR